MLPRKSNVTVTIRLNDQLGKVDFANREVLFYALLPMEWFHEPRKRRLVRKGKTDNDGEIAVALSAFNEEEIFLVCGEHYKNIRLKGCKLFLTKYDPRTRLVISHHNYDLRRSQVEHVPVVVHGNTEVPYSAKGYPGVSIETPFSVIEIPMEKERKFMGPPKETAPKTGLWTWQSYDNEKVEASLVDGRPHGKSYKWDSSGRKRGEWSYRKGKLDGDYTIWDEKGEVVVQGLYRSSKPWDGTFLIPVINKAGEVNIATRTYRRGKED